MERREKLGQQVKGCNDNQLRHQLSYVPFESLGTAVNKRAVLKMFIRTVASV